MFAGFTQGIIRTLLNCVVVLIAFVVASILRDPLFDLLTFWQAFTPELRQEIVYLVLFIGVLDWGLVRGALDLAAQPAADPQGSWTRSAAPSWACSSSP